MDGYLLRCSKNLDIYIEGTISNVKIMAIRFNEGDVKKCILNVSGSDSENSVRHAYRILMKHYYISDYSRFKITKFAKYKRACDIQ